MRHSLRLAAVAVAFVLSASIALADGPFSLFGNAEAVRGGQKPNPFAIKLTSDVTQQDTDLWYGGVNYTPRQGLTFADIRKLSTDFYIEGDDDCFGGSPRFQINVIDKNGDEKNIFVYLGDPPNFTDCPTEEWLSSGNLIGSTDLRYDLSQLGGAFYSDYEDAVDLAGDFQVVGIQLVVDSGWGFTDGEQTILVDNVVIDNHRLNSRNAR